MLETVDQEPHAVSIPPDYRSPLPASPHPGLGRAHAVLPTRSDLRFARRPEFWAIRPRQPVSGRWRRRHLLRQGPPPNAMSGVRVSVWFGGQRGRMASVWSTTIRFSGPVASTENVTEFPAPDDAPRCVPEATIGLIHAFSTAPRASYTGGAVGKGWISPTSLAIGEDRS